MPSWDKMHTKRPKTGISPAPNGLKGSIEIPGFGLIVHEWISRHGGSENVLEALLTAFPNTACFALWNDDPIRFAGTQESWIADFPIRRYKKLALPLMLPTWRRVQPAQQVDWLLVSTHLFAHHARVCNTKKPIPKLLYTHTPARYIWEPDLDQRGTHPMARLCSAALKPLDRWRASEALSIAANSEFTRRRIQRTWGRDAQVIYPPVDVEALQGVDSWEQLLDPMDAKVPALLPNEFILGASRFVPYKRLELAIRAGSATGVPVVIAGAGPQEMKLRELAKSAEVPVHFVISPSTPLLRALLQKARVLVFPAIEDFGILPVEAMALGTPVVTGRLGGTTESVPDGLVGASLQGESLLELQRAVERASSCDDEIIRRHAGNFGHRRFEHEIKTWVQETLSQVSESHGA